jgi:hypothetical protein
MLNRGVDLTTYPALKAEATRVRQVTRPLNATTPAFMPPEPERKWSPERIQTFRNWIVTGFPLGVPTPQLPQAVPERAPARTHGTCPRTRSQPWARPSRG